MTAPTSRTQSALDCLVTVHISLDDPPWGTVQINYSWISYSHSATRACYCRAESWLPDGAAPATLCACRSAHACLGPGTPHGRRPLPRPPLWPRNSHLRPENHNTSASSTSQRHSTATGRRGPATTLPTMQGFNMGRYVPPDLEGTVSGNKLHNKRPASTPTVRFEMPFAVWCASCPKPTIIGQGVRFNAEKRRVGAYHSTPIWSFRIRHADCGGALEIQTDPRDTAYRVVSGGTKRDTGEERPRDGDAVLLTDAEREAVRRNAFASLEKTIADREQLRQATERIEDLTEASARHWDDPYAQNQRLRKAFRAGRKERERDAAAAENLKGRMSLGIDLLPATEDDARRAALVDFGPADESSDRALSKPLFGGARRESLRPAGKLKEEKAAAKRRDALASELMTNTRAAQDPFLQGREPRAPARLPGVKRKRAASAETGQPEPPGSQRVRLVGGLERAGAVRLGLNYFAARRFRCLVGASHTPSCRVQLLTEL